MRTILLLSLTACNGNRTTGLDPLAAPPAPPPGSLGAEVIEVMNTDVDPCTDFYAYACGGWLDRTTLPPDRPMMVRSFHSIRDRNELLIREILDGGAASAPVGGEQLAAFYGSCMDEAAIDARGTEPLAEILAQIDRLGDKAGLMAVAGALWAEGIDTFVELQTGADAKNPGLAILHLSQSGTGLPDRSYYLDESSAQIREAYQQHAEKLLGLAGWSKDAAGDAADILAFETRLAQAQWTPERLRDSDQTTNKMDRAGLDAMTPKLGWSAFLAATGRPELTQFNVVTPSFFEGAAALVAETDLDVLKTWLKWRALSAAADDLAAPLSDEAFRFYGQTLLGQRERRPRWKRCVEKTEAALGDLLAQAYVEQAFAGESKPVALDMVERIESAFEQGLPSLSWMDDDTRGRAVEKARAVHNKIGYPGRWREYAFEIDPSDHFGNAIRASRANRAYWMGLAEKPVDPDTWYMAAHAVNAYYDPPQNEIVFPAGILQPPFFSIDRPAAMNFGAMGMVIGHELTHGFDDDGRKYDAEGRLTEWWSEGAVERFEEVASCVRDQYEGYEVEPGLHLSGALTLGENIADIGGLRLAHRAYRTWVAEHGEEPELAGLTGDQLLFVSHAQAWCTVAAPEAVRVRVASDPHSPPRFRVNGPLSDLPEFAEAFGCEVGEPMRPEDTCEVW